MNYYKATIKNTEGCYQDIFLMAETESQARFKIKWMSDFKDVRIDDIEITFIPDGNKLNPILQEYWGRWIWCNKCGHSYSPAYAKYCCNCGEKFVNNQEEKINE